MKALNQEHRELVDQNLDYVRALAARHYLSWADAVEYDALLSFGCEGLMTAARRFRNDKGARFATFAHYRIHGAILDGAHRFRHLPRPEHTVGTETFDADSPVE